MRLLCPTRILPVLLLSGSCLCVRRFRLQLGLGRGRIAARRRRLTLLRESHSRAGGGYRIKEWPSRR